MDRLYIDTTKVLPAYAGMILGASHSMSFNLGCSPRMRG